MVWAMVLVIAVVSVLVVSAVVVVLYTYSHAAGKWDTVYVVIQDHCTYNDTAELHLYLLPQKNIYIFCIEFDVLSYVCKVMWNHKSRAMSHITVHSVLVRYSMWPRANHNAAMHAYSNTYFHLQLTRLLSSHNNFLLSSLLLKPPACHCLKINQLALIITENTPVLCAGRECVCMYVSALCPDAGCHDICNV